MILKSRYLVVVVVTFSVCLAMACVVSTTVIAVMVAVMVIRQIK